jgi:hypothetical protein
MVAIIQSTNYNSVELVKRLKGRFMANLKDFAKVSDQRLADCTLAFATRDLHATSTVLSGLPTFETFLMSSLFPLHRLRQNSAIHTPYHEVARLLIDDTKRFGNRWLTLTVMGLATLNYRAKVNPAGNIYEILMNPERWNKFNIEDAANWLTIAGLLGWQEHPYLQPMLQKVNSLMSGMVKGVRIPTLLALRACIALINLNINPESMKKLESALRQTLLTNYKYLDPTNKILCAWSFTNRKHNLEPPAMTVEIASSANPLTLYLYNQIMLLNRIKVEDPVLRAKILDACKQVHESMQSALRANDHIEKRAYSYDQVLDKVRLHLPTNFEKDVSFDGITVPFYNSVQKVAVMIYYKEHLMADEETSKPVLKLNEEILKEKGIRVMKLYADEMLNYVYEADGLQDRDQRFKEFVQGSYEFFLKQV